MQRKIDQLEPFQRAISKAHLASAGIAIDSLEDPNKPLIAIANSWNEVCPGHEPLRQLAAEVKKGVLEAGGEPIEFNTIGMCDGVAQGHPGMRYCLPHRDLITDSCEAMIVGEGVFDGVVYMGSCDKIIPGMLNAAARINLPSAIVTAGPCYDEIKPSQSKALRAAFLRGEASERDVIEGTLKYYTGPGICPFLGVSKKLDSSLGMSGAVIFVMLVATAVTFPLQIFILDPAGLSYLQTIVFILVIAVLVQFIEIFLKKYVVALYNSLGVYLPLITTNCCVLAVTILVVDDYGADVATLGFAAAYIEALVCAVGAGFGFMLAMVMFSGVRKRVEACDPPAPFKGLPITLIAAAITSLSFMGFGGLVENLFNVTL